MKPRPMYPIPGAGHVQYGNEMYKSLLVLKSIDVLQYQKSNFRQYSCVFSKNA